MTTDSDTLPTTTPGLTINLRHNKDGAYSWEITYNRADGDDAAALALIERVDTWLRARYGNTPDGEQTAQ